MTAQSKILSVTLLRNRRVVKISIKAKKTN